MKEKLISIFNADILEGWHSKKTWIILPKFYRSGKIHSQKSNFQFRKRIKTYTFEIRGWVGKSVQSQSNGITSLYRGYFELVLSLWGTHT